LELRNLRIFAINMSPLPVAPRWEQGQVVPKPTHPNELILEAWAMGYLVGSLIIMAFITLANMRRGVLLHKLILLEVGLCNAPNSII
jgi:hypothetical protein